MKTVILRVIARVIPLFLFLILLASAPFAISPASASDLATPVNINAATPATLASQLKGIGPSKADAIVRYREKHGAFRHVDELVNVKGIGPKTVEKLRPHIVAGDYKKPQPGESLAEQEAEARAVVQGIVKRSVEIRQQAVISDGT